MQKVIRTSNRGAGKLVRDRRLFKGSNIFSEYRDGVYAVYSYGYHFPMYVWVDAEEKWYGNCDRYSITTTIHQSRCHPYTDVDWYETRDLEQLIMEKRAEAREVMVL